MKETLERVTAEELILLQAFRISCYEHRRDILEFSTIIARRCQSDRPDNVITVYFRRPQRRTSLWTVALLACLAFSGPEIDLSAEREDPAARDRAGLLDLRIKIS